MVTKAQAHQQAFSEGFGERSLPYKLHFTIPGERTGMTIEVAFSLVAPTAVLIKIQQVEGQIKV